MLHYTKLEIEGLKVIEPDIFFDKRGFFLESYNYKKYKKILGQNIKFLQDNISKSKKNVLRGMHYQLPPFSQGKLVIVTRGKIFDVAIDLRKKSKTFGKWFGIILSEKNKKQFWIPRGFAHGFLSLVDNTEVLYKCTNIYSKKHERHINWDNDTININWPVKKPILSIKDKKKVDLNKLELL